MSQVPSGSDFLCILIPESSPNSVCVFSFFHFTIKVAGFIERHRSWNTCSKVGWKVFAST